MSSFCRQVEYRWAKINVNVTRGMVVWKGRGWLRGGGVFCWGGQSSVTGQLDESNWEEPNVGGGGLVWGEG